MQKMKKAGKNIDFAGLMADIGSIIVSEQSSALCHGISLTL